MAKYEVIRAWHGTKKGDVVELKKLHPSLKSNVRPFPEAPNVELVPAITDQSDDIKDQSETGKRQSESSKPPKADIINRLKELEIEFDSRMKRGELGALLPDGDPLKQ